MIDAMELRIGNYLQVKSEGQPDTIMVVSSLHFHKQHNINLMLPEMFFEDQNDPDYIYLGEAFVDNKYIFPIELTKEWLNKLGFFDHCFENCYQKIGSKYHIEISYNEQFWLYYYGYDIANCKYIHQLQNLFYGLCGKELTYDP